MQTNASIEILPIIFGLLGGLALFLYGMEQMTDALTTVAGSKMKNLLARMTSNRVKGAITGAFATAVVQSSSVTTVLVVGFISAGLLSLAQAISIIVGAQVGTTITVQIIAFRVTEYSLLMIAIGFGVRFLVKQEKIKYLGLMLMGFGLIFLGMQLMSDATYPLRSYEPFVNAMRYMENPVIGILVAATFTAIIQSSAATIGIVISLATQGFITLEAGIALTLGANVGTCITAILASIGTNREGKQAAVSHVLINIIGVAIWLPFLYNLEEVVRYISPSFENLSGINKIASEAPRQIANAHTIFNLANSIIFLPFTGILGKLISWILPVKPELVPEIVEPKYVNKIYLKTPNIALDRVRMEIARQAKRALWMVKEIPTALDSDDKQKLKLVRKMDNEVDALHEIIIDFLGKLSKEELTNVESNLLQGYLSAANYIENIGDVVETNLYTLGKERLKSDQEFSEKLDQFTKPYFNKVIESLDLSINSLTEGDLKKAELVIEAKSEVTELADNALDHLSKRLHSEKNLELSEFRIQIDVIENFRRIYYLAKRLAKTVTTMNFMDNNLIQPPIQEELPFQ
ncbi:MAG: Na/Pi cotransporter family protein [Ignavibacteriaceae bacterium]|nr:Na/Pi cotransporter family protein [Ignavibacteria bacterium]MBT8392318.1 Na/Pi cotransporter family protein [Ignavibacteria bacterium]NNJ53758.1 Na/Pi cotransporter family protein [Ignavibacteriaceae bacterium]NNL19821.1 Na/Pi cotransporter family protein [Ignavibacteriaceae bacterium]